MHCIVQLWLITGSAMNPTDSVLPLVVERSMYIKTTD
jgi:hypothetical protein